MRSLLRLRALASLVLNLPPPSLFFVLCFHSIVRVVYVVVTSWRMLASNAVPSSDILTCYTGRY